MSEDRVSQTTASQGVIEIEMGALVRRDFRAELNKLKFGGVPIDWVEHKGWLSSMFVVRAPPDALKVIRRVIDCYNAALTAATRV
jgi:hypothetical protein